MAIKWQVKRLLLHFCCDMKPRSCRMASTNGYLHKRSLHIILSSLWRLRSLRQHTNITAYSVAFNVRTFIEIVNGLTIAALVYVCNAHNTCRSAVGSKYGRNNFIFYVLSTSK